MKIILILLMVCGQPDTIIVKYPNKPPMYTHAVKNKGVMEEIINILKQDPILIKYEDDRGICS